MDKGLPNAPNGRRAPACQACGGEMVKKRISSGNCAGIALALIVLIVGLVITIAIPVVGWVVGPLIILCALGIGGKGSSGATVRGRKCGTSRRRKRLFPLFLDGPTGIQLRHSRTITRTTSPTTFGRKQARHTTFRQRRCASTLTSPEILKLSKMKGRNDQIAALSQKRVDDGRQGGDDRRRRRGMTPRRKFLRC